MGGITRISEPAAQPLLLSSLVEGLEGVGAARAKAFALLGVRTAGDLLGYFPRSYVFEAAELPIADLRAEQIHLARGEVIAVDYLTSGRRRFEATLTDGKDKLALVWFNASWMRGKLVPGMNIRVQGRVKIFRNLPQMVNPRWEQIDEAVEKIERSRLKPIYPASQRLHGDVITKTIEQNLEPMLTQVQEWFDDALLKIRGVVGRQEAYRQIHHPSDLQQAMRARRRIIYDELMLMQLGLGIARNQRAGRLSAPTMRIDKLLDERIRRRFPFRLTPAQQNAVWQIARDLGSGEPMNRLLQGDVGSGKTVVALYAMLLGVANKLQSALLAPTEVLAEQHYLTLTRVLQGSNVVIELFTNRTKKLEKGRRLKELADGRIHLAVGTQALIQRDVEFANLGLVVVDEQHKLGVMQRAVLKSKGLSPHYLVMTATPIPRTLALSYFADFDVTTIDELPPGRQPITTRWLRPAHADAAYRLIHQEVAAGRQAYIVVPQVDDTGLDDSKSVMAEREHLAAGPLSTLRLEILHGQMKTDEKRDTMARFRDRQTDVLIATTVIEVGIDVPNATIMVIDNADRFGLSQLHQLRGRVGRGPEPSHCMLIAEAANPTAEARMQAMCQTSNGFEIAEMDLQLRGPGEFFGTRQHGLPEFKLADLTSEMELLQLARQDALSLLAADPKLSKPVHAPLREALREQFGEMLALAQIG